MKGFPIEEPVNSRTLKKIIAQDPGDPNQRLRRIENWANYQFNLDHPDAAATTQAVAEEVTPAEPAEERSEAAAE